MVLYVVSYDVNTSTSSGQRRLRRVAKICENYGIRVQNSVFECVMDYSTFLVFKDKLISEIDPIADSLRIYPMGKNGRDKVIHVGSKDIIDVQDTLIF